MSYAVKGSAPLTKNWFPSSSYSFVPFTEMGDRASTKLYETNRRHGRRNVNMMGAVPMQPCWLRQKNETTGGGPRQEAPRDGCSRHLWSRPFGCCSWEVQVTAARTRQGRRSVLDPSWGEKRQTGIQARRGVGQMRLPGSLVPVWAGHVKRTATAVMALACE